MTLHKTAQRSVMPAHDYPLTSIAKLHVTLVDAINGYDTMTEKAEPDLRLAIQPFATIHRRHAAELATLLKDNGLSPEKDGSMMSLVHETVVSVRALFGDLDTDALPSVIRGEEAILSDYQEVLADVSAIDLQEHATFRAPVADRLNSHVEELQTLVQQARARIPA